MPIVKPTRFTPEYHLTGEWIYYCDLCAEEGVKEKNRLEDQKENRDGHVFCSSRCGNEYERREKYGWHCLICGESLIFEGDGSFCSRECEKWSGGKYGESPAIGKRVYRIWIEGERLPFQGRLWKKQRQRARERDNFECQRCATAEREHKEELGSSLHVHHIRSRRRFNSAEAAHKLENLITLCANCHGEVEKSTSTLNISASEPIPVTSEERVREIVRDELDSE